MLEELFTAVLVSTLLAACIGGVLALAARTLPDRAGSLADEIDALLPQTQCAQCGFPGCHPYAQAIARGEASIDLCTPGGDATMISVAKLLQRNQQDLDTRQHTRAAPIVARIDESRCTGCALCLPACPVDAIVGASRFAHTVLAEVCTGCGLCIPPCPVDCVSLAPAVAFEA